MQVFLRNQFPALIKDQRLLDEIVAVSGVRQVGRGEVIIDYGAFVQFVPLVVKGLVKVIREHQDGREVLLYFLSGGNSCAATFSCCMVRKRSEIKAIAEEDSTLITIPLESADRWMGKYAVWRNFILNMYDDRLFAMIDTIDQLTVVVSWPSRSCSC